ncbi:hypothetical protein LMG33818_000039 [Halomonadaceae bacterium LMG 33818]|uniref:anti-CBASS protein Acb1 family protein n=1 Tax=Cernens ardua TaxID=3402176 RepID=UPI003EDBBB03
MKRNVNLNRSVNSQSAGKKRARMGTTQAIRNRLAQDGYVPTEDEIKALYGAPRTLGAPRDKRDSARMAMDHQMEMQGSFSLLQHAAQMGQLEQLGVSFMGYGALSGLAQNGLIRACVETVSGDSTREFIEIHSHDNGNKNDDDSEAVQRLNDGIADFDLRGVFQRAAEWDGYFGGCLIYIDTGKSGSELLEPLDISPESAELQNLQGFRVVEPINCFPGQYESTNPLDPYYFEAKTWWILGQEVHSSRVRRIVSNEMPVILKPSYNFFGLPRAQVLYDYVLHFQEARMDASRLLNKFSLTTLKTDMQDILTNPFSEKSLDSRLAYMSSYRSNDGILAIDKDMEDIMQINTPIGGVTDIVRQSLELVVVINKTNVVKTLGTSPAGFNTGDSDMQNHNDTIHQYQEKTFRHALQDCLDIIQIFKNGTLERSVEFSFIPLGEEDVNARSQRNSQQAQGDQIYADMGVISQEEIRTRLATDPDSPYRFIDADVMPNQPLIDDTDEEGELNDTELNHFDHEDDDYSEYA